MVAAPLIKNQLKAFNKPYIILQELRARADQRGQDPGTSPIAEQGHRQHQQVEAGRSVPAPRPPLRCRAAGEEPHR